MTVEQVRVQKKEIKAKDLDSESHWELEIEVEKFGTVKCISKLVF